MNNNNRKTEFENSFENENRKQDHLTCDSFELNIIPSIFEKEKYLYIQLLPLETPRKRKPIILLLFIDTFFQESLKQNNDDYFDYIIDQLDENDYFAFCYRSFVFNYYSDLQKVTNKDQLKHSIRQKINVTKVTKKTLAEMIDLIIKEDIKNYEKFSIHLKFKNECDYEYRKNTFYIDIALNEWDHSVLTKYASDNIYFLHFDQDNESLNDFFKEKFILLFTQIIKNVIIKIESKSFSIQEVFGNYVKSLIKEDKVLLGSINLYIRKNQVFIKLNDLTLKKNQKIKLILEYGNYSEIQTIQKEFDFDQLSSSLNYDLSQHKNVISLEFNGLFDEFSDNESKEEYLGENETIKQLIIYGHPRNIPKEKLTDEVLAYIIKNYNTSDWEYLIKDVKAPSVILDALYSCPSLVNNLPKEWMEDKMFLKIIGNKSFQSLEFLNLKDTELYKKEEAMELVKKSLLAMKYVIKSEIDEELCFEALDSFPRSFKYIDKQFQTFSVVSKAVDLLGENYLYY